MLPLRVVVDTNIVVSAVLKPDSLPRTVMLLAMTKPARLYASAEILNEYEGVLARPALRIRKGLRRQFLQLIRNRVHIIAPKRRLNVTRDPGDNIFIECGDAAGADYLITGNQRHFPQYWKKTKIISAHDFVDLVAPHLIS